MTDTKRCAMCGETKPLTAFGKYTKVKGGLHYWCKACVNSKQMVRSPTRLSWVAMKERCYRKTHQHYPNYGGRGITVCERWRKSFKNFLADMGERPEGMTIDRIDTDGNYEPGNCRWATMQQQSHNRRDVGAVAFGRKLPLIEWARMAGITESALHGRLKRGWSLEDALTHEVVRRERRKRNDLPELLRTPSQQAGETK